MKRQAQALLIFSVIWWYLETEYFGWNRRPTSFAELCCDGLAIACFLIGWSLYPLRSPSAFQRRSTDK